MKKYVFIIILFLITPKVYALNIKESKIEVDLNSCIDGDTAKFNYQNETIKVRFLAIDTPELKHGNSDNEPYAIDANDYTCNELKKANRIYLEFDYNSDKQDKYGRYLAWVFVDNELLQEKIIEKGYAKTAYLYNNYKYTNVLKEKQNIAKHNKLGIWGNTKDINCNFLILLFVSIILYLLIILLLNIKKK